MVAHSSREVIGMAKFTFFKELRIGHFRFALEEVGYGHLPTLQKKSRSQEVDVVSNSYVLLIEEMEVTTFIFPWNR